MISRRLQVLAGASLAIVLGIGGCQPKGKMAAKEEIEAAQGVQLSTSGGSPGMTVAVSVPDAHFDPAAPPLVRVAGVAAPVRVLSPNELEVQVPPANTGPTQLEIPAAAGRAGMKAPFTVLEAGGSELVLSLKDQKLELLAEYPSAGISNAEPRPGGAQFRIDLLNKLGGVVFKAAVDDPRHVELFDQPNGAKIRNEMSHGPVVFRVKVPKLAGGKIQLFSIPPGGAALQPALAAPPDTRSKPLAELTLPNN